MHELPEKEQLLRAEIVRRLDEVVLDVQVLEQELDGEIVVRLDPADLGRRDHDDLRAAAPQRTGAPPSRCCRSTSARVRVSRFA